MGPDSMGRRRHPRHTVHEPCRVIVRGREYRGATVDLSLGGARIAFESESEAPPAPGATAMIFVERIGLIPTRVVRPLGAGMAVEFTIDKDKDRHVAIALADRLMDYASGAGQAGPAHIG